MRKMLTAAVVFVSTLLLVFGCQMTVHSTRTSHPHSRTVRRTPAPAPRRTSARRTPASTRTFTYTHHAGGGTIRYRTANRRPPTRRSDTRYARPTGGTYTWVGGYHIWTGSGWAWVEGRWVIGRHGKVWRTGKWRKKGNHWEFTAGYWK